MSTSRILIIDDDEYITHLFSLLLCNAGYTVREENCPLTAIATAREFRPDLILLDVEMPGKTGSELASEFRHDLHLAEIPVVFVSGHALDDEEGAGDGVEYLAKPFGEKALLSTVNRFCPQRELSACA
jgi:CheY-like chemotaxis protein